MSVQQALSLSGLNIVEHKTVGFGNSVGNKADLGIYLSTESWLHSPNTVGKGRKKKREKKKTKHGRSLQNRNPMWGEEGYYQCPWFVPELEGKSSVLKTQDWEGWRLIDLTASALRICPHRI